MAQTFFVDEEVRSKTRLDSVTTVVDAKHVSCSALPDSREAREQIAFADQIVLNKTRPGGCHHALAEVDAATTQAEPAGADPFLAQRDPTSISPMILERGGFDLDRVLEA